jgi:Leucine-rich repeat (LRR) protein
MDNENHMECYIPSSEILYPGTTVTVDKSRIGSSTLTRLNLEGNSKIFYLPVGLVNEFPQLVEYYAPSCSIKEISKQNFEGLTKLKLLDLSYSSISKITKDMFEDLTSLEKLNLGEFSSFGTVISEKHVCF